MIARPDDFVRILTARPARRPHFWLVGRKRHRGGRRLQWFEGVADGLVGRTQGSQRGRSGLGFRGGYGDHPVDGLCFSGKKSGEDGGTGQAVQGQHPLIRNGALDVGSDGVELAPSSQRALIGGLQCGDDYSVSLAEYSDTLGQRRSAGSRRVSAQAGRQVT